MFCLLVKPLININVSPTVFFLTLVCLPNLQALQSYSQITLRSLKVFGHCSLLSDCSSAAGLRWTVCGKRHHCGSIFPHEVHRRQSAGGSNCRLGCILHRYQEGRKAVFFCLWFLWFFLKEVFFLYSFVLFNGWTQPSVGIYCSSDAHTRTLW